MLVDLCEDETCIPYVLTWRKFGKRYMTLLLNIVRKENKKLEVKMTNSGVIEGGLSTAISKGNDYHILYLL